MCGIAGFWAQPAHEDDLSGIARAMSETLVHRGPDDEGIYADSKTGVALAHRRLAIIDLSASGHQPMTSGCGRYVIVFNGEIYNFGELRKELSLLGHSFRGSSDTEVLLEGIAHWGIRKVLPRLNGMFAFALWDRLEKRLTLARDHLGIKPLYYGWCGNTFLFGSELKALIAHPHFQRNVDRNSLGLFLQYNYIPAPYCIWQGCYKLPPGHCLSLESSSGHEQPEAFWALQDQVANVHDCCVDEAIGQLEELLGDSVRRQMIADVPLGAFLSGGIDSSTVVAFMQRESTRKIRTFTIGFEDGEFDEAKHACKVADYLGTEHTQLRLTPTDALEIIPRLPEIYDEPFADSSQIPTFLVAQLTKQHVTVSLSGDGGDELFAGYSNYLPDKRLWSMTRMLPSALRAAGAGLLASVAATPGNGGKAFLEHAIAWSGTRLNRHRIRRFAGALAANDVGMFYQDRVSKWRPRDNVVINSEECVLPFAAPEHWPPHWRVIDAMAYFDTMNYLPENVLTKVDRASMAVSLETRVPLLDYRIVEFSSRLPLSLKIRGGQGKWILRQVLNKYVPSELVERPKRGFSLPLADWMRGPLRPWIDDLLQPGHLEESGFLVSRNILHRWDMHIEGRGDWSRHLWSVIMFLAWKQKWLSGTA